MTQERRYSTEPLPIHENLEKFAPSYDADNFTRQEQKLLSPFFSNLDKPVFIIKNLPEEMIGALTSRYSRAEENLRLVFLKDYVTPLVLPKKQPDWKNLSNDEKKEKIKLRRKFLGYVSYLNKTGGIDQVVGIQRSRNFFDKWLKDFGDDSIAEMGGVHVCIEGLSILATKEIEDSRIGPSFIEKSTRFVSFSEKKSDGSWKYIVPGEIKGTDKEEDYIQAMDALFETYSKLETPYLNYIKEKYPKGEDETEKSFNTSRSAKRFDDLRDLLPFSTQTNLAISSNGRAMEYLITRLLSSHLGESRYWGQQLYQEASKAIPSFLSRVATSRGAEIQQYRKNINILQDEMSDELLKDLRIMNFRGLERVSLLSATKDPDIEILTAFLFARGDGSGESEIRNKIKGMNKVDRRFLLKQITDERNFQKKDPQRQEVRFRKPPRAFERAHYTFSLIARGGDYRDLQRHRIQTQIRQVFSLKNGYEIEKDVEESPFVDEIKKALVNVRTCQNSILEKLDPHVLQYAVPLGFLQKWLMKVSARELYYIFELRTGQQGKPAYRKVVQEMAKLVMNKDPEVFAGAFVDWNTYSLSRRESAKKTN